MSTELYPEIDFHLNFSPFEPYHLFQEEGQWNGQKGKIRLHTPQESLSPKGVELVYVYGIGLGYHIQTLLTWLEKKPSHVVVILEDDIGAIAAFLQMEHATALLRHPQIHLRFVPHVGDWDQVLEECAEEFPFEYVEVLALDAYRRLKSARFRSLRLQLLRKTVLWHALHVEIIHSHLFTQNIWSSIQRWPESFNANLWKGKFQGVPAVICGAGPSLSEAVPLLKTLKEKALIIGCGSAVSALGHFGMAPHLAMALDPNRKEYQALEKRLSAATPLLYCSRLFPKVFELFQGPLGYLRSGSGGALEAYFEKKLGIQEAVIGPDLGREALSVTTLAVAYAEALGCSPIILVGVDLAYTGLKEYAHQEKRPLLEEKRATDRHIVRKDRSGRPILTLVKWVMESDVLSAFAKKHPKTKFYNASEGLGFRHIPFVPLEELITHHCSQTHPIEQKIVRNISDTRLAISHTEMASLKKELLQSLKRCQKICKEMIQEIKEGRKEGGKAVVLEADLQEELAFEPLLSCIGTCFLRAAQKRVALPHDREAPEYAEKMTFLAAAKWNHLKRVISSQIKALQLMT